MEKVVLLGAGGHCKAVIDILRDAFDIAGITDIDAKKHGTLFYGVPVPGDDSVLKRLYHDGVKNALVTLGSVGDSFVRKKLYEFATNSGFKMINAISPCSVVSRSVKMGSGNTVLDRAVIHADSIVGNNVIINTGSIIEHDCIIEDHVHISPGAILAGSVKVGEGTHIGLGACIIQGITIGRNCIIGAGAVVINDIEDNSVCAGVPAKPLNS